MKVWNGYGSEHSANLVMIGSFRDAGSAAAAKAAIDRITEAVLADLEAGEVEIGGQTDRFSDKILGLMYEEKIHDVGPGELQQFGLEIRVNLEDDKIVLTTDESDVSAFLKILIDMGARVEVYSAHEYPDTGYGR